MYTPYAFIDAENTVNHLARLVTSYISKKGKIQEEVWTVLGDIELNKEKMKLETQLRQSQKMEA